MAPYDAMYELPAARLRAFKVGRLSVVDGGRETGIGIPILAYLLEAPSDRFVIDTGLSARWADAAEIHVAPEDGGGNPYIPQLDGPPLVDQLAQLDLVPDRLVCTHLHEDHASGAAAMGVVLEASTAELELLTAGGAGYPTDELRGLPTRAIELDPGRPLGPFPASLELAEGVIAVDTAGHTPGSISLLARVGVGWALVCGDAVYPRMDQPDSAAFIGALRLRRACGDTPALRLFPAHDTLVLRSVAAGGWLGT